MAQPVPFPNSKEELLQAVDSLPYNKRISYAARLGRDHKDSPKLQELITSLRTHPAPDAPSVQVEEEFTQILPAQKTNLGTYYIEDQLALAAAVSSKTCVATLTDEVTTSPSSMFKQLASKAFVKQEKDDEKVYQVLVNATPAVFKKLMGHCIRQQRLVVLDRILPVILEKDGVERAAAFLHGCSTNVVEHYLTTPDMHTSPFINSKKIHWKQIARHHGELVISLLEKDFAEKHPQEIYDWTFSNVWSFWLTRFGSGTIIKKEILRNAQLASSILQLTTKYPIHEYIGSVSPAPVKSTVPNDYVEIVPDCITDNLLLFIRKFPKEMTDLLKRASHLNYRGWLVSRVPSQFWSLKFSKLGNRGFEFVLALIKHRFETTGISSIYSNSNYNFSEYNWLTLGNFLGNFSPAQLTILRDVFLKHAAKYYPSLDLIKNWEVHSTDYDLQRAHSTVVELWRSRFWTLFNQLNISTDSRLAELNNRRKRLEHRFVKAGAPSRGRGRAVASRAAKKPEFKKRDQQQIDLELKEIKESTQKWLIFRNENVILFGEILRDQKPKLLWNVPNLVTTETILARRFKDANTYLRRYLQTTITNNKTVEIVKYVFDVMLPFWIEGLNAQVNDQLTFWKAVGNYVMGITYSIQLDRLESEENKCKALELQDAVVTYYIELYKDEPVEYLSDLQSLTKYASAIQRRRIFGLFKDDEQWNHAASYSTSTVSEIIESTLLSSPEVEIGADGVEKENKGVRNPVYSAVDKLLVPNAVSKAVQDELFAFQDISLPTVRKSFEKLADAKSDVEREEAYKKLIKASYVSKSLVQLKRSLAFIRKKIKNETIDNRASAIESILSPLAELKKIHPSEHQHYLNLLSGSDDIRTIWLGIIKEAMEAPDRQKDSSLDQKFLLLSKEIISLVAHDCFKNEKLNAQFEFAVEIQWKLASTYTGKRTLNKKFRIDMYPYTCNSERNQKWIDGNEEQFVEAIIKAYNSRTVVNNSLFFDEPDVFALVFKVIRRKWINIPALQNQVQSILNDLLNVTNPSKYEKDNDGLTIIENDNEGVAVLDTLLSFHHPKEYLDFPILKNILESLLKTRQAKRVVMRWFTMSTGGLNHKEKKQHLESVVLSLLNSSESSIHLRFVWRFLINYRQDLLDKFINSQKSFRGVYYLDPSERGKLSAHVSERKIKLKSWIDQNVQERIKKEKDGEKEIGEALEDFNLSEDKNIRSFDHEDFFCLPAVYKLYKLLPRQVNNLEKQRINQIVNPDLSVDARTASSIRWTLLPSVDYPKIVKFYEANSKGKDALAVNILEAILKGTMYVDEPMAPLQFLLSPQFLGSDRARIAIFCLGKTLASVPDSHMKQLLLLVLTGKRRNVMKVTAYKEVIRLLAARPTPEHVNMILHEWNRKELHRDVKITIIQMAIRMLSSTKGQEIGWKILSEAMQSEHLEILISILGASPADYHDARGSLAGITKTPRLMDYYDLLAKQKIPVSFCEKFANDIVLKLCEHPHDDIKSVAICLLQVWSSRFTSTEVRKKIVFYLKSIIDNTSEDALNNPRPDVQKIMTKRFTCALDSLLRITGFINSSDYNAQATHADFDPLKESVIESINLLVKKYLEIPIKSRELRQNLISRLRSFGAQFGYTNITYDVKWQELIVAAFEQSNDLFWDSILRKKIYLIALDNDQFVSNSTQLIDSSLQAAVKNPYKQQKVLEAIRDLITRGNTYTGNKYHYDKAHAIILFLIDQILNEKISSDYKILSISSILEVIPQYAQCVLDNSVDKFNGLFKVIAQQNITESLLNKKLSQCLSTLFNGNRVRDNTISSIARFTIKPKAQTLYFILISEFIKQNRSSDTSKYYSLESLVLSSDVQNYLVETVPGIISNIIFEIFRSSISSQKQSQLNQFLNTLLSNINLKGKSIDGESELYTRSAAHRMSSSAEAFINFILQSAQNPLLLLQPDSFIVNESPLFKIDVADNISFDHTLNIKLVLSGLHLLQNNNFQFISNVSEYKSFILFVIKLISGSRLHIFPESPDSLKERIIQVLNNSFNLWFSFDGDENEDPEKYQLFLTESCAKIAEFINWLRTEAAKPPAGVDKDAYHAACSEIGLSVLKNYAEQYKIQKVDPNDVVVDEAVVDEAADKGKEKVDDQPEEKVDDDSNTETATAPVKAKPQPKKKFEFVWRNDFEDLLDLYCVDPSTTVANSAKNVVTRAFLSADNPLVRTPGSGPTPGRPDRIPRQGFTFF